MNILRWNKLDPFVGPRTRSILATVALSVLVLSGCVSSPKVSQILQVPAEQKILLHAYAKGVQIYVCDSSATEPGKFAWMPKAPEATLFDVCGNLIGSHYAGPTWENDHDGSKVVGEVLQRSAPPNSNAIPWLLVRARPIEGPGRFNQVTYIQRVNTTGGLAPVTPPKEPGQEARVPYTAEYYFYRTRK